jgi:ribosomal protein S18 acetylase RimI-like enzyme
MNTTDPPTTHIRIRRAAAPDAPRVLAGVQALLDELRGEHDDLGAAGLHVTETLIDDPGSYVFLAEDPDHSPLLGVITATTSPAIRAAGTVAVIQELWTSPACRSQNVGRRLIDELIAATRNAGITRVEVGLPHPTFSAFDRTEAFYRGAGFESMGPRMRFRPD